YVNDLNGSAHAVKVPHATQGHTTHSYAAAPIYNAPAPIQAHAAPAYPAAPHYSPRAAAAPQPAPMTTSGGYDYGTRNRPYGWYAGSNGNVDSGLRGSL
ncbi:MAG: hypothetical protein AAFY01_07750, partial [Pseudomonadota bacterium]